MILRILVLICGLVAPSLGAMSLHEFNEKFEGMCFQENVKDPFFINGQETPLSNTMENFISLAEEFEVANPTILLKEELFYFIKNYIFENIQISTDTSGKLNVGPWKPEATDMTEIAKMWESDPNARNRELNVNDPFSDAEKCSLYHMISHSIVDKPDDVRTLRSFGNDSSSSNRVFRTDLISENYFPQEIGVVAVRGTDMAVSLSRVLVGLYVGLNQNRWKNLGEFERIINANLPESRLPQERRVDALYTLTMAEVLMLSKWGLSKRQGLAPNGLWVSAPLYADGYCPMVYTLENSIPAYSYSTVRGAADGLILGKVVASIESKKQSTKLSQILRMYYSRDGIAVDQATGDFRTSRVSFCNRREVTDAWEPDLEQQMRLYGFLVSEKFSDVESNLNSATSQYANYKTGIYDITDTELSDYCGKPLSLLKPEDLPRETNLDVFVLLDTRISQDSFITQQMIVGYLAKYLDLRYTGSRMTVLLDQKINTASTSAKIDLKPAVLDSYSSSCAGCTVSQLVYEASTIDREQIIMAMDQLLEERKTNETKYNGVNGKVVVYFNFGTDERDNNKIQGRLDKAIRDLHLRHPDTPLYAVGLDPDVLKKYARNDPSLVFLAKNGNEEEVAKRLYEKISIVPGLLQYSDCVDGRGENSAVYENFVSPLALQHWKMPNMYFYKSTSLKVVFESQNGPIKVCHNRATMRPELEENSCMNTSSTTGALSGNRIEFRLSNPCKGVSKEGCSPFYFAVMGSGTNGNGDNRPRDFCNDISDHWCSTLDDIKFKVSHEGIRCNGCLLLGAPPIVIFITLLLSYFLHKSS